MSNDICSFATSLHRLSGAARPRFFGHVALVLTLAAVLSSCGDEDKGVTYQDDVRPIFDQRCTICHHSTAENMVNIQNPFAPASARGLVEYPNPWLGYHPEGNTPEFNVVPEDPDNSFLMWKIGDPAVPALDPNVAGDPMPLQLPHLTDAEIQTLETWVADGAEPGEFFDTNVRPIFGEERNVALGTGGTGRCIHCHYAGSGNPPNLSDPFAPDGLVDVRSTYRSDLRRVVPGDVENSFMILKVRATEADSEVGAPMPYSFDPLSASQIATVRQWIVEGARR